MRITIRANKAKTEGNSGLLARFLTMLASHFNLKMCGYELIEVPFSVKWNGFYVDRAGTHAINTDNSCSGNVSVKIKTWF